MGNRSSHYPPPYPYPGPYPDGKRLHPPSFSDPNYAPHLHRSMMSLHEPNMIDQRLSGMRGSRLSLNQVGIERIVVPDTKTLKKLEKMEKKHKKLVKKLALRYPPGHPATHPVAHNGYTLPPPPPVYQYPSPAQLYQRTLSFDDLQRAQLDMAEMRLREQWKRARDPPRSTANTINKSSVSSHSTVFRGGSLSSSSPVTSSSEERTTEPRDSRAEVHSPRSCQPMYSSTPRKSPENNGVVKSIEVKVERSNRVERTEKTDSKRTTGNQTYAQPIIRGQTTYGSRSSMGTSQMRGDQSEIDFSWVSEEEEKIRNERDSLPELYFGMETPVPAKNERTQELREGKENKMNVHEATSMFEEEARKRRRDREVERNLRPSSLFHLNEPRPDYERAPAERRLHRLQRESEQSRYQPPSERQRWRSSIAF